jgi:hypothetical protein
MSSKNLCLTRLPPTLHHKDQFPYEWSRTPGAAAVPGAPAGPAAAVTRRTSTLSARFFRPARCAPQHDGRDSVTTRGTSLRHVRYAVVWLQTVLCSVSAGPCMSLRRLCQGLLPHPPVHHKGHVQDARLAQLRPHSGGILAALVPHIAGGTCCQGASASWSKG